MISPDLLERFNQTKNELVSLAQTLKDQQYGGIVLPVIDRLEETGQALMVDDKGKWSGRLDMMGYEVTDKDDTNEGLTILLLEVGRLLGEEVPDLDNDADDEVGEKLTALRQEEVRFIETNGDKLMDLLVNAMNHSLATYQA